MFVRFEENEEEEEGDFLEGEEKTDQSANFPAPWFRHARSSPLAVAATTSGKPSLSKSARSWAPHHRRDSAGAETTPTVTSSSAISAISVAQTGTPRTKFLVPSIGSITQQRLPTPVRPNSSPITASRGRERPRTFRSDSSVARSASVTGVRSGFA